jgi:hypothetical protein
MKTMWTVPACSTPATVPAAGLSAALEATVERFLALPVTTVTASKRLPRLAFDLERDTFRQQMNQSFEALLDAAGYHEAMAAIRKARGW